MTKLFGVSLLLMIVATLLLFRAKSEGWVSAVRWLGLFVCGPILGVAVARLMRLAVDRVR